MSCTTAVVSGCDDGAPNYVIIKTSPASVEADTALSSAHYNGWARWTFINPPGDPLYHRWERTRVGSQVTGGNTDEDGNDVELTPIEPIDLTPSDPFRVESMGIDGAAMYPNCPCRPELDAELGWAAGFDIGNALEENWGGVAVYVNENEQIVAMFEFSARYTCTPIACSS